MPLTTSRLALLGGVLALLITGCKPRPVLLELFNDESCERACFQGIEVGITDEATVQRILEEANIDYNVEAGNVELTGTKSGYDWEPDDSSPLVADGDRDRPAKVIVFINSDGTVGRMLVGVDICISSVISAYGKPQVVTGDDLHTQLNYPEYGLIFYAGADSPRIAKVDVATKELVEVLAKGGLPKDWSEIEPIIQQECVDNITN